MSNILITQPVTFIRSLAGTAQSCVSYNMLFQKNFFSHIFLYIFFYKARKGFTNNARPSLFENIISVCTFFSPWQRDGFQTGIYSNTVVLQHHSVVMTKADKIYKVKCTYDMSSKNITFGMMPIRDPEMISITSAPEAPPPRIRILDSRSREVETVRIGDKLTFRIEIPEDSKFAPGKFISLNKEEGSTTIDL